MNNLTKRDKFLIYIMGIVVILFVFVKLLIMPALDELSEIQTKRASAEESKMDMKLVLAGYESSKSSVGKIFEDYEKTASEFFPKMTNDGIDEMLSNLFLTYNLSPIRSNITGFSYIAVEPYFASQKAMSAVAKDSGGEESEQTPKSKTEQTAAEAVGETPAPSPDAASGTASTAVATAVADYTVVGTVDDMYRLIDYISSQKSILLTGYTMSDYDRFGDSSLVQVKIGFKLFMC